MLCTTPIVTSNTGKAPAWWGTPTGAIVECRGTQTMGGMRVGGRSTQMESACLTTARCWSSVGWLGFLMLAQHRPTQ